MSTHPNPFPDLLQTDKGAPGDPARKHERISHHPRQRAQQVERSQSDRDVPSTDLAVGQAKDAADEIDMLPCQAKRFALSATRETEKSYRGKREEVGAVRLHLGERDPKSS